MQDTPTKRMRRSTWIVIFAISTGLWITLLGLWIHREPTDEAGTFIRHTLLQRPWMIPSQYVELVRRTADLCRHPDWGSLLELSIRWVVLLVIPGCIIISARRIYVITYEKKFGLGSLQPNPYHRTFVISIVGYFFALAISCNWPLVDLTKQPDLPNPPVPFHFQSLKGLSDDEIAQFMSGKASMDSYDRPDAPNSNFPESLWDADPKAAALAFADANRTPSHRKLYDLTIDEDSAIQAPDAGWLVFDSGSSLCYSFTQNLTVLRFGVPHPFILSTGTNSVGAVGHNPYTDRTSHSLKLIPISNNEARFIAHTIFWLEQIHTQWTRNGDYSPTSFIHSTGDGFGSLDWLVDHQATRHLNGTLWSVFIANRWRGKYDAETSLNLTNFFLTDALAKHLGKRWNAGKPLIHNRGFTPIADRLKPSEDDADRKHLSDVILTGINNHFDDPWPASALIELVDCAGDTSLPETLPVLEKLAEQLPPASADEIELKTLENQFRSIYEAPVDPEAKKQWERYQLLDKQFKDVFHVELRSPLNQAILQLRALNRPDELIEMAKTDASGKFWALHQLQLHDPAAYAEVLTEYFHREGEKRFRILIFNTLATVDPDAARRLQNTLTEKEQAELWIQITQFELKESPTSASARVPALLDIIADSDNHDDWSERGSAIDLLTKLTLNESQKTQFEKLLVDELSKPHRDTYAMSRAIAALMMQPDPDRYWDVLVQAIPSGGPSEFRSILNNLAALAIAKPEPRLSELTELIHNRFNQHVGNVDDLSTAVLALDLHSLTPELMHYATNGPQVPDGEFNQKCSGGPTCLHRYHSARHVISLWMENDPDTRARMWTARLLKSPYEFIGNKTIPASLRDRYRTVIDAASPDLRSRLIAQARSNNDLIQKLPEWLAELPSPP